MPGFIGYFFTVGLHDFGIARADRVRRQGLVHGFGRVCVTHRHSGARATDAAIGGPIAIGAFVRTIRDTSTLLVHRYAGRAGFRSCCPCSDGGGVGARARALASRLAGRGIARDVRVGAGLVVRAGISGGAGLDHFCRRSRVGAASRTRARSLVASSEGAGRRCAGLWIGNIGAARGCGRREESVRASAYSVCCCCCCLAHVKVVVGTARRQCCARAVRGRCSRCAFVLISTRCGRTGLGHSYNGRGVVAARAA